jgi:hypothetical protein
MPSIDHSAPTFGLPESLLFPIAVRSKELFKDYVGEIATVRAAKGGPNKGKEVGLLIRPLAPQVFEPYRRPGTKLKDWCNVREGLRRLAWGLQVWVTPEYRGYREVYCELAAEYPLAPAGDSFLDHVMNRKLAPAWGYRWVRLCPVLPAVDTNAGGPYAGEVRIVKKNPKNPDSKKMVRDYSAHRLVSEAVYADPFEITKMINWTPGTVPEGMDGVAKLMEYIYPPEQ